MRVLKEGGKVTDRRIWFCLSRNVGVFLLALLAVAVSLHFQLPQIGFAVVALFIVFIVFKASFRHWEQWFLGKREESRVTNALKSLPNDYVVLSNIVLPDSKDNVDHVLIGPNGVFAIETQNYSGCVKCEEEQWFVKGQAIRSLSKRAKRNSMAVRSSIGSLFTGSQTSIPYVVPLLVFVSSHAKLKLFRPTVAVLKLAELVAFIRESDTKRPITPNEKRAIVYHLQSLQPTFRELADQGAIANDDLYGVT
jgi:Nuclease-related domain